MAGWSHADLVAAVASVVEESQRCPGCGLSEADTWWVAAELTRCPTCEDRDRQLASMREAKDTHGMRVRFEALTDVDESLEYSSAARFTLKGAEARARRRRERRMRA